MTSIFTKYSELDPALEARQIEAALGGPVFDKWSFLDEARFNAQAAAALGVTLDVAASLDPRRLRDELETFVATYVPRGIKFDGMTWVVNDALQNATENGKFMLSALIRVDDDSSEWVVSWVVDPLNNYTHALIDTNLFGGNEVGFDLFLGDAQDGHTIVEINEQAQEPLRRYRHLAIAVNVNEAPKYVEMNYTDIAASSDGSKVAVCGGPSYIHGSGPDSRLSNIYTSSDGGAIWTRRDGAGLRNWQSIRMSSDGSKILATETFKNDDNFQPSPYLLYLSSDGGATWAATIGGLAHLWGKPYISPNGTYMSVGAHDVTDGIWVSGDSGATWAKKTFFAVTGGISVCAVSNDGTYMIALGFGQQNCLHSSDSGATWVSKSAPAIQMQLCCSADLQTFISGNKSGGFATVAASLDGGATNMALVGPNSFLKGIAASSDMATWLQWNSHLEKSTDHGATWAVVPTPMPAGEEWVSLACSSDASIIYQVGANGLFYKSSDSGASWELLSLAQPAGTHKRLEWAIDGIPHPTLFIDTIQAFIPVLANLMHVVGGDSYSGDALIGAMADFQLYTGVCESLSTAQQYFFKRGLPVDPAIAAAHFGLPQISLSPSNSDPDSFALNNGDGGSFVINRELFSWGNTGTAFKFTKISGDGGVASYPPVGTRVLRVDANDFGNDVSQFFETTTTVAGQIQQIDTGTSFDGHTMFAIVEDVLEFSDFDPNDIVFDPNTTSTKITVSNSGLTLTGGGDDLTFPDAISIANVARSAGKYFFSLHVTTNANPEDEQIAIGLANPAHDTGLFLGDGSLDSVGIWCDGVVEIGGSQVGSVTGFVAGDDVDLRVDLDAEILSVRVNGGAWTDVDISSIRGAYPLAPAAEANDPGHVVTANFGKTPYAHPAPAGFANWTKGAPDWLPDGALAIADFVNGRYYDGVGEVAVTGMLATDTVDAAILDTPSITPGIGWVFNGSLPGGVQPGAKFISNLLALTLLNGKGSFTIIVDLEINGDNYPDGYFAVDVLDPTFTTFVEGLFGYANDVATSSIAFYDGVVQDFFYPKTVRGHHKAAISFYNTTAFISMDGGSVASASLTMPIAATDISFYFNTATLKSITIYPPQDDAALPALSAL